MKEEYLKKGFDGYLDKPVNKDHLVETLAKVLNDPNIIVQISANDQQSSVEKELEDGRIHQLMQIQNQ